MPCHAVFGLFAALGGNRNSNASATNRNPLPRGRACESVDWLTEIYKFLPASSASCGVSSIRVPMTLSFHHSKPHTWYTSGKGGAGVYDSATSGDSDEIIAKLVRASEESAAMTGLEGQVDVVGMYLTTVKGSAPRSQPRTRIEYFDEGLLRDFMKYRPTKPDGVLQLFCISTGSKATCVRARYVQGRVTIETRTNSYFITDSKRTVIERAATFDGDEHCSRAGTVPHASALHTAISRQMGEILTHVDSCIGESYGVQEATAYFRVHSDTKLYLLFMPSVLLYSTASGLLVSPQNLPESPRAVKPVLAYNGSLPKDYFRCPCCGAVVATQEKAKVPYQMMLQHITKLDEADGVADGDSPALRAIAAILDKVGRNPQYYAALYRSAAKSNPQDNTTNLLRNCGYPGGDLELDDQLESPAELICFRLLQFAVAGGRGTRGEGVQLSIAHYKWVRDNRSQLLHRISLFMCTDCSLGISNTAFDNQSKEFSKLAQAKSPLVEAQEAAAAYEQTQSLLPSRRKVEEPLEVPSASLTDNKMRKVLSLPLLKPKIDKRAAANARPWRQKNFVPGPNGTRVSEAPRFAPIGALKGEMPKPDPRYLPFLRAELAKEEGKQRRQKARLVAPPSQADIWKAAGEEDASVFLTQTGSMPALPTRNGGGAQRAPRRLPKVGGAASDAALNAISDVAAGQEALDQKIGALHERMAALEGTLGPAKRAANARDNLRAKGLVADERMAAVIAEIRAVLLKEMPRVIDLFRTFDRNGDGMVSRIEFRQVLPLLRLPNYGNAEIDALFETIDGDGSGFVELSELQKILRRGADIKLSAKLQDGAMGVIETESKNLHGLRENAREGSLSKPLKDLVSVAELRDALVKESKRIIDLFRAFDANADGKVSRGEFRAALPLLGFAGSNGPVLDAIFDEIDKSGNGDGTVEYEELETALRRDDIILAAELQAGAVAFDREAKNAIDLRNSPRDGVGKVVAQKEATVEAIAKSMRKNLSRVTDIFHGLDVNNDGSITRAEFREALPVLGFGAGGWQAMDKLFDSLDESGDGVLEFSELEAKLGDAERAGYKIGSQAGASGVRHKPAQGSFSHLF